MAPDSGRLKRVDSGAKLRRIVRAPARKNRQGTGDQQQRPRKPRHHLLAPFVNQMYLSKYKNVFVRMSKYICTNAVTEERKSTKELSDYP